MQPSAAQQPLHGRVVVITRPVGAAATLMRRVRAGGGVPLHVPGMTLRACHGDATARALADALRAARVIFTSPAAVRYARALQPIPPACPAIGVGQGTARALRRAGVLAPGSPARQDSEGVLALPALQSLNGLHVALIGAAGGRGLLREALAARGARLDEVHVYTRAPARLDRRHAQALQQLPPGACVLWSSAEAMHLLHNRLPPDAWAALQRAVAVVSSARLDEVARELGFAHRVVASSAQPADLLACVARLG
ncbi:uroporphyrinogen-III synthase [Dyella sp.]|jgi:uroporphyrinogen-III synthase|uniref:uroporphyrinogen-III synthase n=1 Tax=Dyella sp. TaxID=1869338 RepID=UPI002D77F6D7|nr:uroporphyrinogen-III synthase [Dyella sp.]HET6431424.1 uroporphyrinogen-III synthase [Dyella sp.]